MELSHIIDQIGREKGIDRDELINVIKSALLSATKKKFKSLDNAEVVFNEETGALKLFLCKKVVDNITDKDKEILLSEALKLNPEIKLDEEAKIPYEIEEFGRIAAQIVKQVIFQQIREKEADVVFHDFRDKVNDIITSTFLRMERGDIIVDLGKTEGVIPKKELSYREDFRRGERIKSFIIDVGKSSKGPQVILSRTHPGLLTKLFEEEVPEIQEGIIEVKGAVREPSGRSKIAVYSMDKNVDAVGACVGMRGIRVQSIVQELKGEKIDIVEWSQDDKVFVSNALSPAAISIINVNEKNRQMEIIVPDSQLSLAIGKKGQNVRLAAKLTRWKIDVKSESEYKKEQEDKLNFINIKGPGISSTLKEIKGISDKEASLLSAHGYTDLEDIVKGDIASITEIEGIGPKKAERILGCIKDYLSECKINNETSIDTKEEKGGMLVDQDT